MIHELIAAESVEEEAPSLVEVRRRELENEGHQGLDVEDRRGLDVCHTRF